MQKVNKYYVVFSGRKKGIFTSWKECENSVKGFNNAKYKSFLTKQEAENAYNNPHYDYFSLSQKKQQNNTKINVFKPSNELQQLPIYKSICVDAACSGNPGIVEYRGMYLQNGQNLFYNKIDYGTNNIGEFLAIVHAISYMKKHNLNFPIYSDSYNAIKWVKQKKCLTKLKKTNQSLIAYNLINRAETWLRNNDYPMEILKWDTDNWGEIPADFGRK